MNIEIFTIVRKKLSSVARLCCIFNEKHSCVTVPFAIFSRSKKSIFLKAINPAVKAFRNILINFILKYLIKFVEETFFRPVFEIFDDIGCFNDD
jgi:hypothetical protein